MIAEIVGPSGRVHYRRPPDDPLVEEARNTPGYSVRLVDEGKADGDRPKGVLCGIKAITGRVMLAAVKFWEGVVDEKMQPTQGEIVSRRPPQS